MRNALYKIWVWGSYCPLNTFYRRTWLSWRNLKYPKISFSLTSRASCFWVRSGFSQWFFARLRISGLSWIQNSWSSEFIGKSCFQNNKPRLSSRSGKVILDPAKCELNRSRKRIRRRIASGTTIWRSQVPVLDNWQEPREQVFTLNWQLPPKWVVAFTADP